MQTTKDIIITIYLPLTFKTSFSIFKELSVEAIIKNKFKNKTGYKLFGPLAHLVECSHGMGEVTGSIPVWSTKNKLVFHLLTIAIF